MMSRKHLGLVHLGWFLSLLCFSQAETLQDILQGIIANKTDADVAEDTFLSVPQLILKYNYPLEVHYVVTEDQYILQVHRMPREGGKAVLLNHGLLDTSLDWLLLGPGNALGYLLYDEGYDVWMVNARGNTYSRNHTSLNPDKKAFWDFTVNEIGVYDLTATMDYISNCTGNEKMFYAGFSQGSITFWIMCSERPEYCDRIWLMQALAPAAFSGHVKSPLLRLVGDFEDLIFPTLQALGINELLPSTNFSSALSLFTCIVLPGTVGLCEDFVFLVVGFDPDQFNRTKFPIVLGHYPAGASTSQVHQYGQWVKTDKFNKLDYGHSVNLQKYNATSPPDYNLKNVRCKVVLHYGENDFNVQKEDLDRLTSELPNIIEKRAVPYENFNHFDFVFAKDAKSLVYDAVLQFFRQQEV